MKKKFFIWQQIKSHKTGFYFLFVITIFMQSCVPTYELDDEAQGSIDRHKQHYSGPSGNASDAADYGWNLGVMQGFNTVPREIGKIKTNFNYGNHGGPYSSLEFLDSSLRNSEETAMFNQTVASPGFKSHIGYMGGIEFIEKNSKDDFTKIHLNYLQIPLYAIYTYPVSSKANIFGGLGPYFAYGIGGKIKSSYSNSTSEIKAFDKTNGFKPFDAGLNFTAGYKIYEGLSFSLVYEFGLVNIERNGFGDKTKNNGLCLNVRYSLNRFFKK